MCSRKKKSVRLERTIQIPHLGPNSSFYNQTQTVTKVPRLLANAAHAHCSLASVF